ncbi:MAG TPA: TolC family protein [Thermoanaerobaculia bacterium]|nr:TolC family protein [Thermoanaerobaculia bacterium]
MSEPRIQPSSNGGGAAARRMLTPLLALTCAVLQPARAGAQLSPSSPPIQALTLDRAIELALGRAPELAAALAQLAGAEASIRLAEDELHPEAFASTTPGYARGLPVAVAGQVPALAGVEIRQSLYDPVRRSAAIETRAGALATRASAEKIRLQTARAVAELYGRCWSNDMQAGAAGHREMALGRAVARAAALRGEGRITELELEQARLREARGKLHRLELESARELDCWELRQRTGWPAEAPLQLAPDPLAGLPEPGAAGDLESARGSDPDLRSDTQAVELLERAARLRGGRTSPLVIQAQAQYSRLWRYYDKFYRRFKDDDWSVAISVALPLWTGGRLRDGVARTEADLARLGEQRVAREAELTAQVRRAQAAVAQAQAAASLARQAGALAEEELRVARAQVAEGRIDPAEIDAREASLAEAEEETVRATAGVLASRVQLLALRGELHGGQSAGTTAPAASAGFAAPEGRGPEPGPQPAARWPS